VTGFEGFFSFSSSFGGAGFSTFGFKVFSRSILPTSFMSGFFISVFISTLTLVLSLTRISSSF
jgi:hypothetical protein